MADIPLPDYWSELPIPQVPDLPLGGSVLEIRPETSLPNVLTYFTRTYIISCTGQLLTSDKSYFSYGYSILPPNQLMFRGQEVCKCSFTVVQSPSASS
jgi:hypothetical protein